MKYTEIKCRDMNCDECPLNNDVCKSFTEDTLDYTLGQLATMYGRRLYNQVDRDYVPGETTPTTPPSKQDLERRQFIENVKRA